MTALVGNDNDYVSLHTRATKSAATLFSRFRNNFYSDPNAVHIFVEGHDDQSLYFLYVRSFFNDCGVFCINCNGKPILEAVKDLAYEEAGAKNKCIFLVDRDFDDFSGTQIIDDARTYITDGYSIENDMIDEISAKIIGIHFLGFDENSEELRIFVTTIAASQEKFYNLLKFAMSICIAARISRQRVVFSQMKVSRLIDISNNTFKRRPDIYTYFKTKCGVNLPEISISSIREATKFISKNNPSAWMRGHYALWAFVQSIKFGVRAVQSAGYNLTPRTLAKCEMNEALCLERLAARRTPPLSLVSFLRAARARFVRHRRTKPALYA